MKTIVTAKDVVKSFGTGTEKHHVLDGISLEIRAGEFATVMGPSGSGKSTMLFALSGMDRIDGGRIVFDEVDLAGLDDDALADLRRTRMGFVFQQPTLLRNLNILDNIVLPSMRDGRRHGARITARAKALMEKTGISGLETRNITEASGGQLQRVGICRALMNDPKVIFGDEPTGALNSTSAAEIMTVLEEIHREGTTIVLVTHDVRVAARSERVLFILDGKITGEYRLGTFDERRNDLRSREEGLTTWLAKMQF